MGAQLIKQSKFMSMVLRHKPESIGLVLDEAGWVDVNELIEKANVHGRCLTVALIQEIVRCNDKQRFSISEDGARIRANQGHSINVDLGLQTKRPPKNLFHGTATRFMGSIRSKGLLPSGRHHVHLSENRDTAKQVGSRHGVPVLLEVAANKMAQDGFVFYLSENGVWLTEKVPMKYIREIKKGITAQ